MEGLPLIMLSTNPKVEGMTLLWDEYETLDRLGVKKNLFVDTGFTLSKDEINYKRELLGNKDVDVIKLREDLMSDNRVHVYAVIEALNKDQLTLKEFVQRLEEDYYIQENNAEEPEVVTVDEVSWDDDIFHREKEEEEDTSDDGLFEDETPTSGPNVGMLNFDIPPAPEVVEPPTKDCKEEVDISNITSSIEEVKDLLNDIKDKDSSSNKEELRNLLKEQLEVTFGEKFEPHLTHLLNEFKKDISLNFEREIAIHPTNFLEIAKPISGDERKEIDNYRKSAGLINYLKTINPDQVFEGNKGNYDVELLDGVEDIIKNSSLGIFEFISKHFPFVFTEYNRSILSKLNKEER